MKSDVTIRVAQPCDMDDVYRITYDAYLDMNYCEYQSEARLIHYPQLDGIPETTVLVAVEDWEIVGTVSLTIDSIHGLNTDSDYKTECNKIRMEGKQLAAAWRLVTVDHDRRVLMGMVTAIIDLSYKLLLQTCLYTFNPRHESVYKRLLNMKTVAHNGSSIHGLTNAPSVLMRLDREDVPARFVPKEYK